MGDAWSARKADLLSSWQDRGWPWWFAPAIAPTSRSSRAASALSYTTTDLVLAHVCTNLGCIPHQ